MEKVLEMDKEKYFLMLAHQGVKLPHDFDVTQLKQRKRISEIQNDTNDTQTRNERIQNNQDNEPRNIDNSLLDLTQQIQALRHKFKICKEELQRDTRYKIFALIQLTKT